MDTAPRPLRWRKSSYSSNGTNCVEVAWHMSSFSSNGSSCVEVAWKKSSFSSNGTDCVELSPDLAAVRDSKNPDGPVLGVDLRRLVSVIKG